MCFAAGYVIKPFEEIHEQNNSRESIYYRNCRTAGAAAPLATNENGRLNVLHLDSISVRLAIALLQSLTLLSAT